ncbi:hypothetical protein BCR42DRAFT_424118 [Absidia repens]|uniref:Phosphatidylinositol-glycan-specific phospholipase D n=1 Tax=Absidia repens TaxID=90262 RepID=A0A1X2I4P7_9FUNG|nr:hypothetical protein BCR42DRAFT_424118 [Absidia repens]
MLKLLARFIPLLTLYLTLSFLTLSKACGIVVHNEVSYRSIDLFKPKSPLELKYKHLLTSFPGFMQAGSFFPDWGYQCLGYNQQSEDAHWAPFIKTAIRYVRETYPQPWTDTHVQGLVVFIFAIMSHDVADVKWHSLNGLDNYFVKVMAEMEFDGNYQKAHTVADTGAEFTLQHASRLGYLNETWEVPLQDLVNIYALYYGDDKRKQQQQRHQPMVPLKDHLHYCMVAAFAGVKLDLKFGKWMFNYYGAKSPFLVDQLNDYHKGGLQDLSASAANCYRDMIHSFENGTPDVLCSNYFDDTSFRSTNKSYSTRHGQQYNSNEEFLSHRHDLDQLLVKNGVIEQMDSKNGVLTLTRHKSATNQQEQQNHEYQQKAMIPQQQQPRQQNSAYNQQQIPFQRLISKRPEFVTPLLSKLTSSRQLQYHLDQCHSLKEPTLGKVDGIPTLSIPTSLAGFGHATVRGDFNGDGNMDLAISAPYHDAATDTTMAGAVFILDGAKPMWRQLNAWNESALVLAGQSSGGRFGWAMTVVDFNKDGVDDLVVATPFSNRDDDNGGGGTGHLDIFFGGPHGLQVMKPDITIKLTSYDDIEGFGSTLVAFDVDQDGYRDLLVGCPYCSTGALPQAGRLDMFLSKSTYGIKQGIITKADRTIYSSSPSRYEHFGSAIAFLESTEKENGGTLVIGAPGAVINGHPKVGKIYGFNAMSLPTPTSQWYMSGKSKFEQFGSVLEGWKNDYLVVSSPTEDTHTGVKKYWQGGSVRLYDWHALDRGKNEIPIHFGLVRKIKGRQVSGHFGASVTFFENKDAQVGLWIGEPLGHNEKGRLYRWVLGEEHLGCLEGDYTMARFGSRVINVESDVICITSQHDSHSARVAGAVRLYQYT